jgi:hypothetical protein
MGFCGRQAYAMHEPGVVPAAADRQAREVRGERAAERERSERQIERIPPGL